MRSFNVTFYLFLMLFSGIGLVACESNTTSEGSAEAISTIEKSLTGNILFEGEDEKKFSIEERMQHHNVPGVSIAVIQDGRLAWAKGYGYANTSSKKEVDVNTVFQAGSISKPVAALAALKLVDQGKIELDEDVNNYLTDWKVPENKFTKTEKVTLRRLLTHTAGLTVHGFPGYTFEDTIPSVVAVLDGLGNTAEIRVDTTPGAIWRYSGGGYTVMQKLVEDVSGEDFAAFLEKEVLEPLGMDHSTYVQPLPKSYHDNASAAFDGNGQMAEGLWNNYPEKAAAGLWTTPTDLVKYCLDVQEGMAGNESEVLSADVVQKMVSKHKNDWGLGPSLGAEGDSLSFGHGGKNRGFSNNMRAFAHLGEGAVIMTNADNGTKLMGEIMRAISEYYDWGWAPANVVKKMPMSKEQLQAFKGSFVSKINGQEFPVDIDVEEDHLKVHIVPDDVYEEYYPISETDFIYPETGEQLLFTKNEAGEVTGFGVKNRPFTFERVNNKEEL